MIDGLAVSESPTAGNAVVTILPPETHGRGDVEEKPLCRRHPRRRREAPNFSHFSTGGSRRQIWIGSRRPRLTIRNSQLLTALSREIKYVNVCVLQNVGGRCCVDDVRVANQRRAGALLITPRSQLSGDGGSPKNWKARRGLGGGGHRCETTTTRRDQIQRRRPRRRHFTGKQH